MKKISIIIISYNRPNDLINLLDDIIAFQNRELLDRVIILNNCSDVSYEDVDEFIDYHADFPFELIYSPENLGVARGRNYAADYARGEILFFIDDDVNLYDTLTLRKLADIFSAEEMPGERPLGVVSLKVFYKDTGDYQVNAFPHKKFTKYRHRHDFLTYYYTGCAHAKSAKAWKAAGEYPNNFFYGMEEYDFSYRLLDAGYSIKYDDRILVLHKESPLGRKPKAEKLGMMLVNKSTVARRYLPKRYFYSTVIMWSFFFILKSGFNVKIYFRSMMRIFKKIKTEKRPGVSPATMNYLRRVKARLWY